MSRPYWVTIRCSLEHSSARLALSHSGCPLSFLFVNSFLFNSRESARVLYEALSVFRADVCLERVVQPLTGQSSFPANAVSAQVSASPGVLAFLIYLNLPLRSPDNARQFALCLYLLTLNASPQRDVFG